MGCSLDLLKSPQDPAAARENEGGGQIYRKRDGNDDVMDRKSGVNTHRRLALNGQRKSWRYDFERCISV